MSPSECIEATRLALEVLRAVAKGEITAAQGKVLLGNLNGFGGLLK